MEVLAWLWWLISSLLGLVWSVLWFLLGGWVSTLAQIGVVVLVVFGYKYGWRRAPHELFSRLGVFGRFSWGWLRARERPAALETGKPGRDRRRGPRGRYFDRRQPGDVRLNLSTCLSLLAMAGLAMLGMV